MTTERGILFSAPMVRALLAGTKTQTRRALRIQPPANTVQVSPFHHPDPRPMFYAWTRDGEPVADHLTGGAEISEWPPTPCPYGQPGDRLWVREAFIHEPADYCWEASVSIPSRPACTVYRADAADPSGGTWKPSIHMPRALSRITLEVTEVRVERLQAISEGDALAEGVTPKWEPGCSGRLMEAFSGFSFRPAASAYADLWEQINGPGSWSKNPWVWAVSFKRAEV